MTALAPRAKPFLAGKEHYLFQTIRLF